MAQVKISRDALQDLDDIWEYVAEYSIPEAGAHVRMIRRKLRTIAQVPNLGRARPELGENLRGFPVDRYVVSYRPLDDGIEVVRVLHGSRDIPSAF